MQGDCISLTFHRGYFSAVVEKDCIEVKRAWGEGLEAGSGHTVTNCEWGHR